MNTNSQNPAVGKAFEAAVAKWFEHEYHSSFVSNYPLGIGQPPKLHRFDIVNIDLSIVIECKCYTWTETGNVSSAKMGFVNEAVFYLSFLTNAETYIVMKKAQHPKRNETLAEYYYRTNKHLLGYTKVLEYDLLSNVMRHCG